MRKTNARNADMRGNAPEVALVTPPRKYVSVRLADRLKFNAWPHRTLWGEMAKTWSGYAYSPNGAVIRRSGIGRSHFRATIISCSGREGNKERAKHRLMGSSCDDDGNSHFARGNI